MSKRSSEQAGLSEAQKARYDRQIRVWGIEFRDFVARRLDKPVSFLSDEVYLESADVVNEELLRIQFIQAIYFVITGQYYTTEQQILKLSSFHFFYKFGAYKPQVHKRGF